MIAKMNFSYLAVLCCVLVTSGALGNLTVGYSTVQAQQEAQLPSTITYDSPWSNNLSTAQPNNASNHNVISNSSQAFTNSKNFNLNHSFVSNKVVGPDRFRFVTSYWTLPDTSLGVDVGTSTSIKITNSSVPTLAASSLPPNQQLEVDTNEGPSTLAVVLQYQGVVDIAGVTAALKLPIGFKALFPLTDDKNNYDIALSDYRGHIYPGQGIVLYFPVNVLPTAKIVQIPQLAKTSNATGLPERGPLALHFLRADERSALDLLDASQQNIFAKALSVKNATFHNSTNFNNNFDLKRHYLNQFGRLVPYDFVNQVIPVILAVTGKETIDVVTLPNTGKFCGTSCPVLPINATTQYSKQIVDIPSGVTSKVRLALRNTGDIPAWYIDADVDNNATSLQSTLGINGLTPSSITSPNLPQTLFSTILPMGIVGPQDSILNKYYLPPNTYEEFDLTVFPSRYAAGTVQLLNLEVSWTSVIGTLVDTHYQVYVHVT